jgi:uncharacterized repeat protein (TIGR01451 family)
LVAGTTVNLEVTVYNNTGTPATFVGWIDFDANGSFDAGEGVTATIPSSVTTQIVQVPITIPIDADITTGGNTYARFRLSTDALTTGAPTGVASNGEIEDYRVTGILPPGVSITKTDGQSSIVVGQSTTYTITVTNSGVDVINRQFIDTPPTGDPNGFDPSTLTWTCAATGGASARPAVASARVAARRARFRNPVIRSRISRSRSAVRLLRPGWALVLIGSRRPAKAGRPGVLGAENRHDRQK